MMENQAKQKALPYEYGDGWVAVQNAALTIYTLHPEFRGNTLLVYMYLLKNYNRHKGYSFPSYDDMTLQLNISRDVVSDSIATLRKLKMINVNRRGGAYRASHVYTFNPLIDSEEHFAEEYPEAMKNLERRRTVRAAIEAEKAERETLIPLE
ncbi:hypothetical protein ACH0B6_18405 [Solibacillus silvestris]